MMSRRYRMEAEELAAAEAAGRDRTPVTPRPAAAVVLVREADAGPQVLLVRRRADVGFAAGAHVFPGGTLDEEDADPRWAERLVAPPDGAIVGTSRSGEPPASAFLVAALRELFEETGVLLAAGDPPAAAVRDERKALVAGERGFLEIVSAADLRLAADRLILCARWITPESLSRRYDARFFLAEAPPAVEVAPEPGELVEHVWTTPAAALARYDEHRFPMLFPTAVTLGWLEKGGSVAEWRSRFLTTEVEPILPRLRRVAGDVVPVLPDDPRYQELDGDG